MKYRRASRISIQSQLPQGLEVEFLPELPVLHPEKDEIVSVAQFDGSGYSYLLPPDLDLRSETHELFIRPGLETRQTLDNRSIQVLVKLYLTKN